MIITITISVLTSVIFFICGWYINSHKKNKTISVLQQQIKQCEEHIQVLEKEHQEKLQQFEDIKNTELSNKRITLNSAFLENGRNVENISEELKEAQSVIEKAFLLLPDIYTSSQKTIHATQNGKEKIDTLSYSVDSWVKSIDSLQNIQGLIDAIYDKANQIRDVSAEANLLALNASIEAARAGEHGRGFAVVATSMRELSNKSAEATIDINTTVDKTRSEVTGIINGISESLKLLTHVTTDVNNSFANIENEVKNIDKISEDSISEADLSKHKFNTINTEVNTQLENITKLLADTLGEVTGVHIEDISVNDDFSGMKIIDVRRQEEFCDELGHIEHAKLICLHDNFEQQIQQLDKSPRCPWLRTSCGRRRRRNHSPGPGHRPARARRPGRRPAGPWRPARGTAG